ncbi:transcobalamin-2-like isoform X2 [Glandiceps talaboti]
MGDSKRDGLYTTKISLAPGIRRGGASEGHSEGHSGGFDFMESYTDTEFSYQKHSTRTIIALIIAIVIVAAILGGVLFSMYVFNESSNLTSPASQPSVVIGENSTMTPEQSSSIASNWLLTQRDSDYGWKNTPQSLIALRLSKPEWFVSDQMQSTLSIKRMETEILEQMVVTPGRVLEQDSDDEAFTDITMPAGLLATYINAMVATCQDLNSFSPCNLLKSMEHDMQSSSEASNTNNYYYYSLGLISLCNSDGKISNGHIESIKNAQLPNGGYRHGIDATSMVVVALSCLSKGKKEKTSPEATINSAIRYIIQQQRNDGSFGSEMNTANAVQALLANGMDPDHSTIKDALTTIVRKQKQDGSFGSILNTAIILPTLAKKTYIDIKKSIECEAVPTQSDDGLIDIALTLASDVEDSNITELTFHVNVMPGSSLYEVLHQVKDLHDEFLTEYTNTVDVWGHSIVSINGHKAERTATHQKYWTVLLSKDMETSLSIDDIIPSEGDKITLLYTSVALPQQ